MMPGGQVCYEWDNMKEIVVLGGGESGLGAAILARQQGFRVFVSDRGAFRERYRQELKEYGIPNEEGRHDEARILDAELVIKSPGIPDTVPLVVALRTKGVPVISEIEFAGRFSNAFHIGITGSNGKTTTTRLLHHLLLQAGFDAGVGGNVGNSFARLVAGGERPIQVLELSSFQLDGIDRFRPDIALLLNISPDHLDRYDYRMERYVASKFRINRNQEPGDLFLYKADNPYIREYLATHPAKGRALPLTEDLIEGRRIRVAERTFDLDGSSLLGRHNAMNALFAARVAIELGADPEKVQEGLQTFVSVPHRLEYVGEIGGVAFYNDSKATNVDSVYYALEAMDRPLIWMAGGQDKGNDYSELLPLVREKVRAMVCLGADNRKLKTVFGEVVGSWSEYRDVNEAVRAAWEAARPGDAVLLSPACASFDLFQNYEDRGDQFRAAVRQLIKEKN